MKASKEIYCSHAVFVYFDDLKPEVQEELIGLYGDKIKDGEFLYSFKNYKTIEEKNYKHFNS